MFESVYIAIYGMAGLFVLFGIGRLKKRKVNLDKTIELNEVTVVVPFKNEAPALPAFIDSIVMQKRLPRKIIFVNDHSSDCGEELLGTLPFPNQILSLPNGLSGKKQAIRYGLNQASTKYVLTMDADVRFKKDYFEILEKLPEKEMLILPVKMVGKGLLQRFYALDYTLPTVVNRAMSGWGRPFLASGANLLFNRKSFQEVDSFENHRNIASGDDIFLLNDFRRNKRSVYYVDLSACAVETDAPKTFRAFIDQRLRWIGKGNAVGDGLSNLFAIFAVTVHLAFLLLLIVFVVNDQYLELTRFVAIKCLLELVVYGIGLYKEEGPKGVITLFLSGFIYPIYIGLLLLLLPSYRPRWKGV